MNEFNLKRIEKYSESIQIIEKENFDNDKFIKEYIAAYFI